MLHAILVSLQIVFCFRYICKLEQWVNMLYVSQQRFACSYSAIESLEKGVNFNRSSKQRHQSDAKNFEQILHVFLVLLLLTLSRKTL